MKTLKETIALAKKLMTKHGMLEPTLLIEGTRGSSVHPLPNAEASIKLSILEALGYTLAKEQTVGQLGQVFLLAEGWRSKAPYTPGLPMTQPRHDPRRVEVVMVFHYNVQATTRRLLLYDAIRGEDGALQELRAAHDTARAGGTVLSPPLEALLKGFARGRATPSQVDRT